jgi:hypothetical protein
MITSLAGAAPSTPAAPAATATYGCPKNCDYKCAEFNNNVIPGVVDCGGQPADFCQKKYGPLASCFGIGKGGAVCWVSVLSRVLMFGCTPDMPRPLDMQINLTYLRLLRADDMDSRTD